MHSIMTLNDIIDIDNKINDIGIDLIVKQVIVIE